MKTLLDIRAESWLKAALYALLLAALFHSSHSLMISWWGGEDYNYGYLIAPITLYLIWEKRAELAAAAARPSWAGLAPLAFGIFLFWLGELGGEYTTMYFASWFVLAGLLWLHLGWAKLKVIWFPILFLNAMFPPPEFVNKTLTFKLKLLSSEIGVAILHAYGMSAYREGNIIDLGFTQLQVVDACSGLRYLYPLIIMGVLLAYFWKAAWWKKVVLVVSAVPLTIITNSFRIAMTGILYEIWGPAAAEDFFHGFSGWLIFIFGLVVLLFEMEVLSGFRWLRGFRWFGWLGALKERGDGLAADPHRPTQTISSGDQPKEIAPPASPEVTSAIDSQNLFNTPDVPSLKPNTSNLKPPAPKGWRAFFQPPQFIVAVILLSGTLALAQGVEFREKIPPAKSFAEFPVQVGGWAGKRDVMEEKFLKDLDLSDYVIVDYVNGGREVNFYTAYYESQRKGESIHSPETCLPGSGWEFKKAGSVTLPLTSRDGKPMRVNKALMEKGASKQLSYFWFPARDRVLTNAWELKWYNFWDALTRQRTDGALVRLITPVYANESVEDADKRLVAFTREIVPVLNEFLPK